MPLGPFLLATLIGATLWNSFLLVCGMKLREHWSLVQTYSHQVDIVVVLLILGGAAWFARARVTSRSARSAATARTEAERKMELS
jgi:membrane protein DedA with SNARE-associated domain